MAFKSKITPSIGVAGSPSTVTPTVFTGQTATLIGLSLANTTASTVTVSAKLLKNGGQSAFLIKDAVVLPGGALAIIGGDQKVVLEEGDAITTYSSAASSVDTIISYLI
jgi:hypothetical protein